MARTEFENNIHPEAPSEIESLLEERPFLAPIFEDPDKLFSKDGEIFIARSALEAFCLPRTNKKRGPDAIRMSVFHAHKKWTAENGYETIKFGKNVGIPMSQFGDFIGFYNDTSSRTRPYYIGDPDNPMPQIIEAQPNGKKKIGFRKMRSDEWIHEDAADHYFKEMGKTPLLSAEEEVDLAKRIEAGMLAMEKLDQKKSKPLSDKKRDSLREIVQDAEDAVEHMVKANQGLVVDIAKRYRGRGVPFLDLIQEGNIGLLKAIEKFEYQRGNRFSTYATWWIRQAVTRAIADQGRTIRVPVHMVDKVNRMYRMQNNLTQDLGRQPTNEELAGSMETTTDTIEDLQDISRHATSLETPVGEDDESEFGDFIEDTHSPNPANQVVIYQTSEAINDAFDKFLPPREAQILRLRYGLEGGRVYTLEEVGQTIGVTRERVRQLEAQALNRLRAKSSAIKLRDAYEAMEELP